MARRSPPPDYEARRSPTGHGTAEPTAGLRSPAQSHGAWHGGAHRRTTKPGVVPWDMARWSPPPDYEAGCSPCDLAPRSPELNDGDAHGLQRAGTTNPSPTTKSARFTASGTTNPRPQQRGR